MLMLYPQGETDKEMYDYTGEHNENASSTSSWIFSGVNKRFKDQTANINNNSIWGKLQRTDEASQGTLSSSSQETERDCGDFADVKLLTLPTRTPHPMGPESDVTTTQDCGLDNCFLDVNGINRGESSSESLRGRTVCERGCQGADSQERERENALTNDKDGVIELLTADGTENEPLTVKERICNIDLSIEWIKSELSLMKAQSLSLMEQYEQLFEEIMDLKLRVEMEKDEELDPLPEEEMSFTDTRF